MILLKVLAVWCLLSVLVAAGWAAALRDRCRCEWCESRRTSIFVRGPAAPRSPARGKIAP